MDIERVYEPDREAMKKALRLAAGVPEPEPVEERNLAVVDGVLYDADTGEIIEDHLDERFYVDSIAKAEWVLEKMLNREAALAALETRKANLDALLASEKRRLEGLHRRFDGELGELVRKETEGKKTKSLKTEFGTIGLRMNRGRHEIIDMAAAIAWTLDAEPELVLVTERVNVSDLMQHGILPEKASWLQTTEPHEDVYVRTGLKKGGGAE